MRRAWCKGNLPFNFQTQVITILKSREQHVAKMMALYQERAVLARQAAEMAMRSATAGAGASGMLGNDDNSNMGVLMRHGYLYCARSLVAVHRVLECVKVRVTQVHAGSHLHAMM